MTPLRLRSDNFTPATRTPWGGRRIVAAIKAGLPLPAAKAALRAVGESWELSVDPAFPSRLAADDRLLVDALPEAATTPMLVKLLDAATDLSVQVHPPDGYPGLGPGESGKTEVWYILHREPGAGIWLGLADGVTRDVLTAAIVDRADLRPFLNFVPVEPGDCFVVTPGTVHAIGAGVTLVEPQLVWPGRAGKTYRLWDWGRRYDAAGAPDPAGDLRPLHVADALAVAAFDAPLGPAAVAALRRTPELLAATATATWDRLCATPPLTVERVRGDGALDLPDRGALTALVVVRGRLGVIPASARPADAFDEALDQGARVDARAGETLVLPAALGPVHLDLDDAEAIVTWCRG